MEETWKPIIGYESLYEISSTGRVKSLPKFRNTGSGGYYSKEKILTPFRAGQVNLLKGGVKTTFSINRLMSIAFPSSHKLLEGLLIKDIKGYEGLYAVSSCGKVWSYTNNIFLTPRHQRKTGYDRVHLVKDGKIREFLVHRLVAEAFIPNPENKPQVNHLDENKTNNHVENLEWATRQENINYGTHNIRAAKANSRAVQCVETGLIYESGVAASRTLAIVPSSISTALKYPHRTAGGFHWRRPQQYKFTKLPEQTFCTGTAENVTF